MLGEFLNWGWTTKYTRSLEIEVARLRAENLALQIRFLASPECRRCEWIMPG